MTTLDKGASPPDGAMAAKNDDGNTGYAGPRPPTGQHHYRFRVYALANALGKLATRAEFRCGTPGAKARSSGR
jgi:phosphatidylethanolamine-binding protein (PEBP) family uncharacterized protein